MKNIHSTDGWAEDLIRSFTQLICSEGHIKSMIEKTTSELENGIVNVDDPDKLNKALEKLDNLQEELTGISEIRRKMMLKLFETYNGDKEYWCQVKHLANAAYTAFEAWQGSDDDSQLYEFALETNSQFVRALSHFIGTEITSCSSCIGDMLKGGKTNGEEYQKDRSGNNTAR